MTDTADWLLGEQGKSALVCWQVRNLIDGQRQLRPVEKVLAPGGSSADLHADEIPAGQAPHYTMQAPGEPPGMPRTSEGAVSIEAKLGKSLGSQGLAGHAAGVKDGGLQEVLAGPHVTITAHSATIGQGGLLSAVVHSCQRVALDEKPVALSADDSQM